MAEKGQQDKLAQKRMEYLGFDFSEAAIQLFRADSYGCDANYMFNSVDFLTLTKQDSVDSYLNNTQMSYSKNNSTQTMELPKPLPCHCNCKKEPYTSQENQEQNFQLSLTRQNSNSSRGGFRLHKDASEKDVRDLFMTLSPENEKPQYGLDFEIQSRSTEADFSSHSKPNRTSLAELAMCMLESNRLNTASYGELQLYEKLYIANILYIKNRCKIDPKLDNEEFVHIVNLNLGEAKEKRNDDRLRFIYKRAIKHLLSKTSEYMANKLHKKDNFKGPLVEFYFPNNPEVTEDLMDTSFASRKKLLKFFKMSSIFKHDFLEFATTEIKNHYFKYTKETFEGMNKHLTIRYSKKDCELSVDILLKTYKRLPWRSEDVQSTIDQIKILNVL